MTKLIERIDIRKIYDDVKFLADTLNTTVDEIIYGGYAYVFTELTDEEARDLGAKAYLKYVGKEVAK